jgi:hypothetical protein
MSNKQIDVLEHRGVIARAGKKADAAVTLCCKFLAERQVTRFQFWPEDFDAICKALKDSGFRSDGFYVANIKAVRYNEGR